MVLGIDGSKAVLDGAQCPAGPPQQVANDEAGIAALVATLQTAAPTLIVVEASGGYARAVVAAGGVAGVPIVVVHPRQVRDVAGACGRLAKTAAIDAALLAVFGERVQPAVRPLPDAAVQALGALRLQQATVRRVMKSLERHVAWLARQLRAVDRDLQGQVEASPLWPAQEDRLRRAPGVGQRTALTLLTERPELGRLSRRRLARWSACRPLHGHPHRRPLQPGLAHLLSAAARRRQAPEGGARRLHAHAAGDPQRDGRAAAAAGSHDHLIFNTVALPARGERENSVR